MTSGTLADRVLELLGPAGALGDDEIAQRLGVIRQHVNQACRRLEREGLIVREKGWRGKIVNRRTDSPAPAAKPPPAIHADLVTEDEVKATVQTFLKAHGYSVKVAWGRERGVDIEAHGPDGRMLIEAKGDAPTPQMQGNYFLGALGELLQRMDDPEAHYALALPDNPRFRGLLERLPLLAVKRLGLRVFMPSPLPPSPPRDLGAFIVRKRYPGSMECLLKEGDGVDGGLLGDGAFEIRFTPVGLPVGVLQAMQPVPVRLRHTIIRICHGPAILTMRLPSRRLRRRWVRGPGSEVASRSRFGKNQADNRISAPWWLSRREGIPRGR
jgi:biotin operon repressor